MNTNGRLAVLEQHFTPRCPTCRAWPALTTWFSGPGEEPVRPYPARCSDCGRSGPLVIVFSQRPDGPQ
ncbi:MAG: hypothetical protein ACJ789_11305 [Thermomicrobiales bacterium]